MQAVQAAQVANDTRDTEVTVRLGLHEAHIQLWRLGFRFLPEWWVQDDQHAHDVLHFENTQDFQGTQNSIKMMILILSQLWNGFHWLLLNQISQPSNYKTQQVKGKLLKIHMCGSLVCSSTTREGQSSVFRGSDRGGWPRQPGSIILIMPALFQYFSSCWGPKKELDFEQLTVRVKSDISSQ